MEIVHCINLQRREDRIVGIVNEAKQQGFAIRFWEGNDEPERRYTKRAICQSHKRIVQYAKDNKLPYVLIMEDDCRFSAPGAFQYFIDSTPDDFDIFCALIYHGEVSEEFQIKNGMSGTMTLYRVHERFYNFILNEIPDDCHIDRELGGHAHRFKYFVSEPMVCFQSGGFSDNLKTTMYYDVYLEGKSLYK
jgi:hypothetical protein